MHNNHLAQQQRTDLARQRDAIALWCDRACAALFVFFLLANAAGAFE